MAKTQISCVDDSYLGIKVKGDLGKFQIIEETDGTPETARTDNNRVSSIPSNLVQASHAPVYGSVAVKNSENVQFGNNTYFNGPVTIKQVINSKSGVDNASYVQTDEDNDLPGNSKAESKGVEVSSSKKFEILLWHKVTFLAMCVVIIGGICAVLSVVLINNSRGGSSQRSHNHNEDVSDSKHAMVVESPYDYLHIFVLTFTLTSVTFMLMSNFLLIRESSDAYNINKYAKRKTNHIGDPLLIAPNHLRIVPRSDWLAQPVEGELDPIRQPVPWVIITHTATESCSTQSECVLRVRLIQSYHIESRKWFDIGYNFLVAGDGSAYFGRGWDYIGAHTLGYNKYSIAIAFIGTFNNEAPPKQQLAACQKLIRRGVESGKLAKDYKLFAHRQLFSTLSPGDKLFDIIKEWPHFVKNLTNLDDLLPHY